MSNGLTSRRSLAMRAVFTGLTTAAALGCQSAAPPAKGLSPRAPTVAVVARGGAEDVASVHGRCTNTRAFSRDVAALIRRALDVECRLCRRDTYGFDLVVANSGSPQGSEVERVTTLEPYPYAAPDTADQALVGLLSALSLPRLPNNNRCVFRVTVTWPYP